MDVEKLIETLRQHGVSCVRAYGRYCSICDDAATALSTLQTENSQLRESRDHWKRLAHELSEGVNGKDAEHERLQAENEKLRAGLERTQQGQCAGCSVPVVNAESLRDLQDAPKLRSELEQVKAEKDAAVESIPHECKTCVYHTVFFNGCTLDHDCTNPDGGCSNNYDRWKWRGPHKED